MANVDMVMLHQFNRTSGSRSSDVQSMEIASAGTSVLAFEFKKIPPGGASQISAVSRLLGEFDYAPARAGQFACPELRRR
jgi:hypothetical protein